MGVQPRFALGIVAQLLLGGCVLAASNRQSGSAPAGSAEERAIREVRAEQNRAIAAGDADLAATFWTEDVTIRRALGQDVHGRTAYRQLIVPAGNRDSSLIYQRDPATIDVSGRFPLAFETGTWVGQLGGIWRTRRDRRALLGAVGEARRELADPVGAVRGTQLFGRGLQLSGGALSLPDLRGFPVACVRHCLMARHCGVSDGERDGGRAPDQWISVSSVRTR